METQKIQTAKWKDMLGQPLRAGQQFMTPDWSENDRQFYTRYGVVTEVTVDFYILKFNEGSGSQRGSKRRYQGGKILVNFEAIVAAHPENFL